MYVKAANLVAVDLTCLNSTALPCFFVSESQPWDCPKVFSNLILQNRITTICGKILRLDSQVEDASVPHG